MRGDRWLYIIPLRLRSLFRRRHVELELDEELQYHIERVIEDGVRHGLTVEEARYAALRAMDGLAFRKEQCRDARGVSLFYDILLDLRYSIRLFRRTRGLVAVAVLSLAIGIGANTAIFSVMDALMFKKLPVRNPQELVLIRPEISFSHPQFVKFRSLSSVFSGTSAIWNIDRQIEGEQVPVALVSGDYLPCSEQMRL